MYLKFMKIGKNNEKRVILTKLNKEMINYNTLALETDVYQTSHFSNGRDNAMHIFSITQCPHQVWSNIPW